MIYTVLILSICLVFPSVGYKLIADNLKKPIYATYGDDESIVLYVAEQSGKIWAITQSGRKELFLDISKQTHQPIFPGDERGLLGFTFPHNFKKTLYVNYIDRNNYTKISRIYLNEKKYKEEVLISFEQPYSNHNGGAMVFGPDEHLYIAVGDGGSSGDPGNRAQDLGNFFGSILRINVDMDSSYTIPADNPFYNNNDALDEIWMYGLRNPWRFTFDKKNGDIYIGDVGQNTWEEINYAPSGVGGINFGWSRYEADEIYKENIVVEYHTHPIYKYANNASIYKVIFKIKEKNVSGCSVTGGYVYRGKQISSLFGKYIFGDYCTGKIFSIKYSNGEISDFIDLTEDIGLGNIYLSSFAEDKDGELYLIDYSGSIYKLVNDF